MTTVPKSLSQNPFRGFQRPGRPEHSTGFGACNKALLIANLLLTATNTAPASPSSDLAARYTVRKAMLSDGLPAEALVIPRVLLSASHAKLCKLQVGERFPALKLPLLGGQAAPLETTALKTLRGKQATVVLFWHPDRWMARTALVDMQRDIASKFAAQQVAVVGIAVRQAAGAVQASLNEAQAAFPQLLDSDGQALAAVGADTLPRLYVLNSTGTVVWFDIEYSEGTRRELWQTLGVLTAVKNQ